jgi:phosphoribosyl-ATP pyrophosphohydrolase
MTREELREAAMQTPECIDYQITGKAHEEASKVLHAAKAAFDLAGLADQRAALAYHSTPEFQALKDDWKKE